DAMEIDHQEEIVADTNHDAMEIDHQEEIVADTNHDAMEIDHQEEIVADINQEGMVVDLHKEVGISIQEEVATNHPQEVEVVILEEMGINLRKGEGAAILKRKDPVNRTNRIFFNVRKNFLILFRREFNTLGMIRFLNNMLGSGFETQSLI
ncbi:MAG: hypothetical protein ACTSRK_21035, partial [Promethearchaeota archaeon]